MQEPESKVKMVKIRALQTIRLGKNEETIAKGTVVEVPEEVAKDFCRPLPQHHKFRGERHGADAEERHVFVRAELVTG